MDERLWPIFARRSIRRYTDAPVTEEDLHALLEAGMAAPSASNRKPWQFVVVTDRETLSALAEVHPSAPGKHMRPPRSEGEARPLHANRCTKPRLREVQPYRADLDGLSQEPAHAPPSVLGTPG